MSEIPRIRDSELNQIEFECSELFMETPQINAIQLKAIIQRLRDAERGIDLIMPYVQRSAERNRLKEINDKWTGARLGSLIAGMVAGMTGCALALYFTAEPLGTMPEDRNIWLLIGSMATAFMVPFCVVVFPLLKKIDRVVFREMENKEKDA